jgi:hypothetical protein
LPPGVSRLAAGIAPKKRDANSEGEGSNHCLVIQYPDVESLGTIKPEPL